MTSLEDHIKYKDYTIELTKITNGIDEISYLCNNLDTAKIDLLLKDIAENYDYVPPIEDNDDYREGGGYSFVEDTSTAVDNITEDPGGEYINMTSYIDANFDTIKRKCTNLKELTKDFQNEYLSKDDVMSNTLISKDYENQKTIYVGKIQGLIKLLNDQKNTPFKEQPTDRIKFNIQLIAKNDIRCIIGYTRFKMLFKNLHVADKEDTELTKEDTRDFKVHLYNIYKGLCKIFNTYLQTAAIIEKIADELDNIKNNINTK